MLPLGLQFYRRRCFSFIRSVALEPTGISNIQILDAFIPDIITGTINDFYCDDFQDQKAKALLDISKLLCNFSASSQILHIMKHKAGAPCTHCSSRQGTCEDVLKYPYHTNLNHHNGSFPRTLNRTVELCSAAKMKENIDYLGMKLGAAEAIQESGRGRDKVFIIG